MCHLVSDIGPQRLALAWTGQVLQHVQGRGAPCVVDAAAFECEMMPAAAAKSSAAIKRPKAVDASHAHVYNEVTHCACNVLVFVLMIVRTSAIGCRRRRRVQQRQRLLWARMDRRAG